MSIIKAEDLGQDYEDKPPKDGKYALKVVKSEHKATKKGDHNMIALALKVDGPEGDGLSLINHYLTVPNDDDDNNKKRMGMRNIVRFLKCFGWTDSTGSLKDFDPEENAKDLEGATGSCEVRNEKGDDGEEYPRLRLPKAA